MIIPEVTHREIDRLQELDSFSILGTLPESDYDDLTAITASICGTKISLVSLVDEHRQWFKSHHGLDATETPRNHAFCAHAIHEPNDIFIIPDARKDHRFHDNPLVTGNPHVTFYAGVPILSNGLPMGTLCVIDDSPKTLSDSQIESLKAIANQVTRLLELRKQNNKLKQVKIELESRNEALEKFAVIAAHDTKSPLQNIMSITNLLLDDDNSRISADKLKPMILMIAQASVTLKGLVDGLLSYNRSSQVLKEHKDLLNLNNLREDMNALFNPMNNCQIKLVTDLDEIKINKLAVEQILINLIGNAKKYNDKKLVEIEIGVSKSENMFNFYVRDNGPGISKENFDSIFEIFKTLGLKDRTGEVGNGIGLAKVRKLVEELGGEINVESEKGKGAIFHFSIAV